MAAALTDHSWDVGISPVVEGPPGVQMHVGDLIAGAASVLCYALTRQSWVNDVATFVAFTSGTASRPLSTSPPT
ncbi:MAG: hypothetical protein CMH83_05915 [Nocardioides sp.]|nr:hypothetical protein [Nocardioides sp.]